MHVYTYSCMYVYIYIYIYMYVCIFTSTRVWFSRLRCLKCFTLCFLCPPIRIPAESWRFSNCCVYLGGTQTGSYQTGSYQTGSLYPCKTNLQIWFLGTTPFDATPFICLRVLRLQVAVLRAELPGQRRLRDKDLYATTNKCLRCLIKLTYTVF